MRVAKYFILLLFPVWISTGCDKRATRAQHAIRTVHLPAVQKMLDQDIQRHLVGIQKAADKIAPGFRLPPATREAQMRAALAYLQRPPKGIVELFASPRTFMAAVLPDGEVLVKDSLPDQLRGMNLSGRSLAVHTALTQGIPSYGLVEFDNPQGITKPLVELVFAAACRGTEGGAVVLGIPLWRLAQRITKQLQLDFVSQKGLLLWAYIYRGDELHHFGTPPDLDKIVPSADARKRGLLQSPGGFTGEVNQFGRWYAYGVIPLPKLGKDIGLILFRSDPV